MSIRVAITVSLGIILKKGKTLFIVSLLLSLILLSGIIIFGYEDILFLPIFAYLNLVIIRFIAGIGVSIFYLNIGAYILRYFSPRFKRKPRESRIIFFTLILFGYIYIITLFINTLIGILSQTYNEFMMILGMIFSIITLYILPIWREEDILVGENLLSKVKEKIHEVKLKITEFYNKYITRDYLKAYSVQYIIYRAKIDKFRRNIALKLLPIILLGIFPILPLFIMTLYILLDGIRFHKKLMLTEKSIIIVDLILLTIYDLQAFQVIRMDRFISLVFGFPYLIGLIIGFYIYLSVSKVFLKKL